MKFCMVTTFFGGHSFGGDAAYVDRLSRALLRRGHEVHVFHCGDAFNAVRGKHPLRPYEPPDGLHIHKLESPFGLLSPLASQVTGRPIFKANALREQLDAVDTDVVHFHNISLIGGPGVLNMGKQAVRLMTAHEHWLICPMHLLWKYGKKPCDKPQCVRCSLAGKRPPQAWRYTGAIDRGLQELDALIFPTRHTLEEHRRRGIGAPMVHLPYFLPDDWSGGLEDDLPPPSGNGRPYLAAAGRLVAMKGFQQLIPIMRYLPEVDLKIAGTGPYERNLRKLAAGLPNVHFEGLLSGRNSLTCSTARGRSSSRRCSPRPSVTWCWKPSPSARRSSCIWEAEPSPRRAWPAAAGWAIGPIPSSCSRSDASSTTTTFARIWPTGAMP